MSTFSSLHAPAPIATGWSWTSGLSARAKQWWMAYINWRIEHAAVDELCRMSDRELKDIGVYRSDIMRAARLGHAGGAFRRND